SGGARIPTCAESFARCTTTASAPRTTCAPGNERTRGRRTTTRRRRYGAGWLRWRLCWGRDSVTREQAVAELTRLCDVYERKPSDLRPHQLREWLQALQDLPYELGRAAVTHLVRTWTSNRFPTPGALTRAADEVSVEGRANALAYYT